MKISIFGAGAWGGSLAKVASDNGHEVLLYDYNDERVKLINNEHRLNILDIEIPKNIKASNSIEETCNFSNIHLIAVPTKVIRDVLKDIKKFNGKGSFINVAKGIEPGTLLRMSEIFEEILGDNMLSYTVLTGPTHAEEVIKSMTTLIVAASSDEKAALEVQNIFSNKKYFRVYTSHDVIGCELGGSLKNVIALASGMVSGLHQGDNARAALITRSVLEMERIIVSLGGSKESVYGLTGLGDLIVTAMSNHSRNYNAGIKFANGYKLENIGETIEGVRSCKSIYEIIKKNDIYAPIFSKIYDVIYNKENINDAFVNLLDREYKKE